ncbi:hypothetical protein ABEF93_001127 [Exophiala dermatitidis]
MFDSFDIYSRPLPNRRHSGEQVRQSRPMVSRHNSSTSIKSEPGFVTSPAGGEHSGTSSCDSQASPKRPSLARLFSKSKEDKEKKASKPEKPKKKRRSNDPILLTSRHAAAVRAKLASDPKYRDAHKGLYVVPQMVGTQNSQHLTAQQQAMRRPHSGPPTLSPVKDRLDAGTLTRIISGDEVDDLDEWQRTREEWKQTRLPDIGILQIVDRGPESSHSSGTATPEDRELRSGRSSPNPGQAQSNTLAPVTEVQLDDAKFRPKPLRRHTPIGLRWQKDENGVWKR